MECRQTSAQGTYTNFVTKTPSPLGVSAQSTVKCSGLTLHPGQQSPCLRRSLSGNGEVRYPGLADAIGRGLAASTAKAPRRTHPSPYHSSGADVRLGLLKPFNHCEWTRGFSSPSDRPQPAACLQAEACTHGPPASGQSINPVHHRPTDPKPTTSLGPHGLQPQDRENASQHPVQSQTKSPQSPMMPQAPMSHTSTVPPRHRVSGDIFGRRAHASLIRRTAEVLKNGASNKEISTNAGSNNVGPNKGGPNHNVALSLCPHPETGSQIGHTSTSTLAAGAHKTPENHSAPSRPCAPPATVMSTPLPQNSSARPQLQQASSRPCRPGPAPTNGPASSRPSIPGSIFGPGLGLKTATCPSTAPVVVDLTKDANEIRATWKAKKLDWLKEAAEKRLPQTSGAVLGAKRRPGAASKVAPASISAAAPVIVLDDDGHPEVPIVTSDVPVRSLAPPTALPPAPAPKKRGRPRKDPVSNPATKRKPKTPLTETGCPDSTVALPPTETQKKRKRADTTTPRPAVKRPRNATGPIEDAHADPVVANPRKRKEATTATTRPPAKRQRKAAPAVDEALEEVRTPGLTRVQHGRNEIEVSHGGDPHQAVVEYPTPPRTESGHESEGYLSEDPDDTEHGSDGLDDLFDGALDEGSEPEDSSDAAQEIESIDDELVHFLEAALDETSESGDDINDVEKEVNKGEPEEANESKQPEQPMQLLSPAPSRHLFDSITYNPDVEEDVSEEE